MADGLSLTTRTLLLCCQGREHVLVVELLQRLLDKWQLVGLDQNVGVIQVPEQEFVPVPAAGTRQWLPQGVVRAPDLWRTPASGPCSGKSGTAWWGYHCTERPAAVNDRAFYGHMKAASTITMQSASRLWLRPSPQAHEHRQKVYRLAARTRFVKEQNYGQQVS